MNSIIVGLYTRITTDALWTILGRRENQSSIAMAFHLVTGWWLFAIEEKQIQLNFDLWSTFNHKYAFLLLSSCRPSRTHNLGLLLKLKLMNSISYSNSNQISSKCFNINWSTQSTFSYHLFFTAANFMQFFNQVENKNYDFFWFQIRSPSRSTTMVHVFKWKVRRWTGTPIDSFDNL